MTKFLLSNFGAATLSSPLLADATELKIAPEKAVLFPEPGVDEAFTLTLWDATQYEILYATSNPLTGTITVQRGQEGTTPITWLAGTQVRQSLTAGTISQLLQASFVEGNLASEAQAVAGALNTVLMSPLRTLQFFNGKTSSYTREFLESADVVAARAALGWESAVFSGTGLEDTFTLPDASWDSDYTKVYVDEVFQTSGYDIVGDQLVFSPPPGAGTDNITVVKGINFAFSVSFPGNNTVDTNALVDDAVTADKLAANSVYSGAIQAGAVTYGKLQNVSATDKVLGRASAGAGAVEEINFTSLARTLAGLSTVASVQGAITSTGWPVPTGTIADFLRASAPGGWVVANGGTIGNAASSATNRANADTQDLFIEIWNGVSNTDAPIQDSSGNPSTRGATAADDFAANKRLPLPDLRNIFRKGKADARALGSYEASEVGTHNHGFTTAAAGEHGHPTLVSSTNEGLQKTTGGFMLRSLDTAVYSAFAGTTPTATRGEQIGAAGSHTHTGTTNNNSGTENRPNNRAFLACIKL